MHKIYTFHNDPGHGWLQVPKSDLETLGIREQISGYSYQNEDTAFLEEDQDASIFLNAARAAGWQIDTNNQYENRQSFVRQLPPYD